MRTETILIGTRQEFETKYESILQIPECDIKSQLDNIEGKPQPHIGLIFYKIEKKVEPSNPELFPFDINISIVKEIIWIRNDVTDVQSTLL